jgi:chloramphenicol-sensitive protein RarD
VSPTRESRRGLVFGIAAYGLWGIIPLFWKLLAHVPPVEILAHRALWGLGAFVLLALIAGLGPGVRAALADRRTAGVMALSGALIAVNWGVFVAAVAGDRLLDASLGYFINPLVSVALGMLVLGERLRRLQWLAIALAGAGVAVLTWQAGRVPWVALILAVTFGLYGLVRKTARVDSLVGSTVETALLAPVAAGYLAYLAWRGGGELGHGGLGTQLLLVTTGIVTAVPLLLFTMSARRLPLSTVGFLQYLAPTGQFLLAVLAFGEPFSPGTLAAFVLIWIGLAAFSLDLYRARAGRLTPAPRSSPGRSSS